nr:hypothetical protein [Rhodococcus sp. KBS0724]
MSGDRAGPVLSNVFPLVLVHAEDPHSVEMPGLLVDKMLHGGDGNSIDLVPPTPNALAAAETDILSTARQCRIHLVVRRVMAAFGGATRSMRWRNADTS